MKHLILGDCDHLIKLILFGDENNNGNRKKFTTEHIPRSVLWKKNQEFAGDDDFRHDRIKPTNDLELAIYHCRG